MEELTFIKTNIGVVAVRRLTNDFSHVWLRKTDGTWNKYHFYVRERDSEISDNLLETLYINLPQQVLAYEDWW